MRFLFLLLALSVGGAVTGQTEGSLWSDVSGPVLIDAKAHEVGDVLTVIVSEVSSASSKADTKTSKDESASLDAGIGPIISKLFPEMKAGGSLTSNATGSTTRSGNLTARLSVMIKQVLPNGTMVIEGKRDVMVNKEIQKMVLTGIVRQRDVNSDNTLPSYLIANAEIQYEGKGPIGDKQRDGLIIRLFKGIFGGIF